MNLLKEKSIGSVRRQAERVARTREKILASAQRIFARDGFEAAKLEEIASDAGYTRGAFYANYKNKEELFVAAAGRQIENHISIAFKAVRSRTGIKAKIHEMLQKISNMPESRTWALLMIEFSLFILRQPQRKKHLVPLYDRILKGVEIVFGDLFKEAGRKPLVPISIIGIGFYSLVQGLVLQEMLNDSLVTPKVTNELLSVYLHAVLGEL
jgi:AcrR family transcriptional regulator